MIAVCVSGPGARRMNNPIAGAAQRVMAAIRKAADKLAGRAPPAAPPQPPPTNRYSDTD